MMGKIWRLLENLIVTAAFVAIIVFVLGLFLKPAEATPSIGIPVYCDPHNLDRCLDKEEIQDEICERAYRRAARRLSSLDNDSIVLGCILLEKMERLMEEMKIKPRIPWPLPHPFDQALRQDDQP